MSAWCPLVHGEIAPDPVARRPGGARAVLQFYPETAEQAILISECAAKVGFAGGIVVDYPNSTKAKKHYLVLSFDRSYKAPKNLTDGALLSEARSGVRVDKQEGKKGKKGRIRKAKGGAKTKLSFEYIFCK